MLALQRSAGNRAVSRFAAELAASRPPAPGGHELGATAPDRTRAPQSTAAPSAGPGRAAARNALAALPAISDVRADLRASAKSSIGEVTAVSAKYRVDEGGEQEADRVAEATAGAKPARGDGMPPVVTERAGRALDRVQDEPGERIAARPAARVHRSRAAAEAADALGAKAFAVGDHIGLAADVDASTAEGEALLAHELAHVVQAGGAPEPPDDEEGPPADEPVEALTEPASPFTPGPPPDAVAARGDVVRRAAIDAEADNTGALAAMFDAAAENARATVTGAATAEATKVEGSLDKVSTTAAVAIGETRASISETFAGQEQAVAAGFAAGKQQVEAKSGEVTAGLTEAAAAASGGIAAAGAAGAEQVTAELTTREAAVKAEGEVADLTAEADRERSKVDAAAAQIIGQYSGHEKISDIRAGVQATAGKAKGQIGEAVAAAQSEARGAASEIAGQPRAAEPEQRAHAERAAGAAAGKVDEQRSEAEAGVGEVKATATAGLEGAEGEISGELATARQQSDGALAGAAATTSAAVERAKADTKGAFSGFGEKASAQLGDWRQAAQSEQEAIEAEVGNLFAPDDLQPLVEDLHADASADGKALSGEAAKLAGAHAAGAGGFAGLLNQSSGATTASLFQAVGAGLSSLQGAVGSLSGALASGLAKFSPGFAGMVRDFSSVIDGLLGSVRRSGDEGQGKVASGMAEATASSRAEINKIAANSTSAMANVAANDGDTPYEWSVWDGIWAALKSIGKNIVNLLWGFVWGDPWFEDEDGGEFFAFVGDVVAGILIYGDVRDIIKWGLVKPLIMGEGYSWENALMIGLALVGLVPIAGDIVKVGGKGGKLAVRLAMKAMRKKLGQELAARLVKELGEEAAAELAEKLTKATIEKLLKSFDAKALKALTDELGAESVERLAKELSADAIKGLVDKVGTEGLKKLLAEFSPSLIKQIGDELGDDVLKTVADDAPAFAAIIKELGFPQIKALLKGNIKVASLVKLKKELGTHFADVALELGPKKLSELMDTVSGPTAKELIGGIGVKGLRELMDSLGGTLLAKLARDGAMTPSQILAVSKLGKEICETYSPKTLAKIAGLLGNSKYSEVLLKKVLTGVPSAALEETVENLVKDPTGKILKCYSELGITLTNQLIGAMGLKGLADAAAEVEPSAILEMLKKCASPAQFARLCKQYGGAKALQGRLAAVRHANELEGGSPPPEEAPHGEEAPPPADEPNFTPAEPDPEPNHTPAPPLSSVP